MPVRPFGAWVLVPALLVAVTGFAATADRSSVHASTQAHARVLTLRFNSPTLSRPERVLVYEPPTYRDGRRYPLVLFLHGVPGKPEDLVVNGVADRIDALIRAKRIPPIIAAFPTGSDQPTDDNEWADSEKRPGERWETYVTGDVLGVLQHRLHVRTDAAGRAIAGISMGGFGAMNIALHHRDLFAAVGSWSGYFNSNTPSVQEPTGAEGRAYSPQLYASALQPPLATAHPAISFYVGSRDSFAGENVAFDKLLTQLGVPHHFVLVAGADHTWKLWWSRLDAELQFLGRSVGQPLKR
jgi:S-formylglutathione hydrolase FrmB